MYALVLSLLSLPFRVSGSACSGSNPSTQKIIDLITTIGTGDTKLAVKPVSSGPCETPLGRGQCKQYYDALNKQCEPTGTIQISFTNSTLLTHIPSGYVRFFFSPSGPTFECRPISRANAKTFFMIRTQIIADASCMGPVLRILSATATMQRVPRHARTPPLGLPSLTHCANAPVPVMCPSLTHPRAPTLPAMCVVILATAQP